MKYGFLKRPKSKNWKNSHAKKRKTGFSRRKGMMRVERDTQIDSALALAPNANREYLAANCVVLTAAIIAKPWAKQWAEDWLPQARLIDGRTIGI
jgi:ribosomal protein L15E